MSEERQRPMTVADLLTALNGLPRDAIVAAEGYDQSCLHVVAVTVMTAADWHYAPCVVLRTGDLEFPDPLYLIS